MSALIDKAKYKFIQVIDTPNNGYCTADLVMWSLGYDYTFNPLHRGDKKIIKPNFACKNELSPGERCWCCKFQTN